MVSTEHSIPRPHKVSASIPTWDPFVPQDVGILSTKVILADELLVESTSSLCQTFPRCTGISANLEAVSKTIFGKLKQPCISFLYALRVFQLVIEQVSFGLGIKCDGSGLRLRMLTFQVPGYRNQSYANCKNFRPKPLTICELDIAMPPD